jgi:hypothetical protein
VQRSEVVAFLTHEALAAQRVENLTRSEGTRVCRADLPELLHKELGGYGGADGPASAFEAIELGVAAGTFSATLLKSRHVKHLFSVDAWDIENSGHGVEEYFSVLLDFRGFGDRSTIVRSGFADALYHIPDASLHFVYIDGNAHTGQEGGETIEAWFSKVAPGGMLAGHDYDVVQWPLTYHNVNVFANKHSLTVKFTEACEDDAPSWYVRAPNTRHR